MEPDEILETALVHSDFGLPACSGTLKGIVVGDRGYVYCGGCRAIVQAVPPLELCRTLDQMELTLDLAIEMCPRCGAVNLLPGASKISAYVCLKCGRGVMKCETTGETGSAW